MFIISKCPQSFHHQLPVYVLLSVSVTTADAIRLRFLARCEIGMKVVDDSNIQLIPPIQEYALSDGATEDLKWLCELLYPAIEIERLLRVTRRCFKIGLCGEIISSMLSRSRRSSCISAIWQSSTSARVMKLQYGHIQYFLYHTIMTSCCCGELVQMPS